jgi:hypothetical protein
MTATITTTMPTTTTAMPATRTTPADGLASMLAYLTRVLKTPTIGRCWAEPATAMLASPVKRGLAE